MKEERCSNCFYNGKCGGEYICMCPESDLYGLETGYDDSCEQWEERQ